MNPTVQPGRAKKSPARENGGVAGMRPVASRQPEETPRGVGPGMLSLEMFTTGQRRESNPRPELYESSALPAELHWHGTGWNRTSDLRVASALLSQRELRPQVLPPALSRRIRAEALGCLTSLKDSRQHVRKIQRTSKFTYVSHLAGSYTSAKRPQRTARLGPCCSKLAGWGWARNNPAEPCTW